MLSSYKTYQYWDFSSRNEQSSEEKWWKRRASTKLKVMGPIFNGLFYSLRSAAYFIKKYD